MNGGTTMSGTPQLEELQQLAQRVVSRDLDAHAELKATASLLLNNADLLLSLTKEVRESVLIHLFPHFDLPAGWLVTARAGKVKDRWIATAIVQRVTIITTEEQAEAERPFIEMLLEPAREQDAMYRYVLSAHDLDIMARAVGRFRSMFDAANGLLSWKTAAANNRWRPSGP